ncbi:TolC family protein [Pedobacter puniceum]|uniref:TolC family protein n=1 Tax=Pedobacter puniceum TaxID=2666136 RepID=A0A7K0FHW2_9SPHI|nr:TolC family protein [Pedobacter puniceum]MRX45569.1 TolC family protein [Pedobacter puniceum]
MKYINQISVHSKNLFILVLALTIGYYNSNAQESPQKVDLKAVLESALANNLQIKQAQFQEAVTDENFKQSRYQLLPNLNGSVSANKQYGLFFDQTAGTLINGSTDAANASLSSNLLVFNGFRLQNQIKQNKNLLMADKSNVEKVKNDLTLTVINTYLQALTNRDLITASQQQVDLSKAQLNVEQRNFDVGNKTLADLSQAKAQLATNELNLTNAQNAYDLSILDLKQLMEINPETQIELVVPTLPELSSVTKNYTGKEVFDQAINNYPDIKLAKYNSEAFKYGVKAAKGGLYPSLGVGGQLFNSYSSNAVDFTTRRRLGFSDQIDRNFLQVIGLNLQIPIFDNYRNRSSLNIAKIRYQDALVTEQLAKNNLNKIINQAVLDLRSAEKRYVSTQSSLTSSQDAFEVIKKRYDVGLANAIELNTSQTNYNKAQFDFIQAKYDLLFRAKVIDFYLGNPINL